MASASSSSSGVVFVPSAVIEKALVHDMVYAGCPRCFTSVGGGGASASSASDVAAAMVRCRSCGASFRASELQYKYRLKLQVAHDDALVDAMLFDEAARALLGVQATHFKRALLPRHPALPFVLADLLEGLHVAFHFQRRRPPSGNAPGKPQYTKDLKIVRMAPLVRELLPKPAVPLALDALLHGQQREVAGYHEDQPSSDDVSGLSTQ